LLPIAGKDTLLVVYDRLLEMMHFVVIIEKTLAEKLVRVFKDNM